MAEEDRRSEVSSSDREGTAKPPDRISSEIRSPSQSERMCEKRCVPSKTADIQKVKTKKAADRPKRLGAAIRLKEPDGKQAQLQLDLLTDRLEPFSAAPPLSEMLHPDQWIGTA